MERLREGLSRLLDERDDLSLADAMRRLGIPKANDVAMRMITGWANLGIGEVTSWLDSLSSTEQLEGGAEMRECWGLLARRKIERDPYRLVAFLYSPFPIKLWKEIDRIGREVFSITPPDQRRLHGAVMSAIFSHYERKHTVIDRKRLLGKLKDRLDDEALARKAVGAIGGVAIRSEYTSPAFLTNGAYCQALGAYHMEAYVAEHLARRLCPTKPPCPRIDTAAAIARFERTEGYRLSDEQSQAITVCLQNELTVIKGGAGVGKTAILRCLSDIIEEQGEGSFRWQSQAERPVARKSLRGVGPALSQSSLPVRTTLGHRRPS